MEELTGSALTGCDAPAKLLRADGRPVEWAAGEALVPYEVAHDAMRRRAAAIAEGTAEEIVWLLEHPPLYTSGTSARAADLLEPGRFPVHVAGRGGEYTYHGPGQRVAYVMLDLRQRGRDVRCFVRGLESWIIEALAHFNIRGERSDGAIGVWTRTSAGERKIAAIGVRVSRWVSLHGIALNVMPDLSHFDGIVPCGIADRGVTSLEALGQIVSMHEVDAALRAAFEVTFGPTRSVGDEGLVSAP